MTPRVANLNPATSLLPTILSTPTSRRTTTGPHMVMSVGTITTIKPASQIGHKATWYIKSIGSTFPLRRLAGPPALYGSTAKP